mmetsp:Transcript_41670/g.90807  ORF Transcript_41670/g.90807 Transcript_41670/m.90807 type:complete len:263 (-) Transcript_41670:83-871(-)|eukprot:CAMPEP_0170610504 /NCGR_PEP_ID=MMETSP0224-20130122/22695_1 /TAXON_ID=285029 /ORGANISM="Togula jolla, Strain CCCM 725" /LENGTH=262 /DNA_ID=CAMNT_0010935885 /DNA_START=94 /DNA_END=882 /DNA_ORIENTATION=-
MATAVLAIAPQSPTSSFGVGSPAVSEATLRCGFHGLATPAIVQRPQPVFLGRATSAGFAEGRSHGLAEAPELQMGKVSSDPARAAAGARSPGSAASLRPKIVGEGHAGPPTLVASAAAPITAAAAASVPRVAETSSSRVIVRPLLPLPARQWLPEKADGSLHPPNGGMLPPLKAAPPTLPAAGAAGGAKGKSRPQPARLQALDDQTVVPRELYFRMLRLGDEARGALGYGQHRLVFAGPGGSALLRRRSVVDPHMGQAIAVA